MYILWVLIIFKNVIQTPDVGGRYKTNFLAGPLDLHSQRPMRAITSGWRRETTHRRRSVTLISNNHKPNGFSAALKSLENKRSNNSNIDDNIASNVENILYSTIHIIYIYIYTRIMRDKRAFIYPSYTLLQCS